MNREKVDIFNLKRAVGTLRGDLFNKLYSPLKFVRHLDTVQECFSKCVLEGAASGRTIFLEGGKTLLSTMHF